MEGRAGEARAVDEWGPVLRGYQVLLADGQRGSVEDIRLGDDGVELVVATGLFVRRHLTVREDEIEAILPAAYRVVVRDSDGVGGAYDVEDVETVGGILRMPVLNSLRPGSLPKDAA
jgi:hypothetical protein